MSEELVKTLLAVEFITDSYGYSWCPWCEHSWPEHEADCVRQKALGFANSSAQNPPIAPQD